MFPPSNRQCTDRANRVVPQGGFGAATSVKSAGSAPINKTSSLDASESGIQEVSGVKSVGSTLLKPASEEDGIAAPTSSDLFKPSGR